MTRKNISAQNIKCAGCAAAIEEGVGHVEGVRSVTVDIASGTVTVDGEDWDQATVRAKLADLGYPAVEQ